METKQRFTVMEHPPWYLNFDHKDVFTCESTQGLFDEVVDRMTRNQEEISEREKRYKPKTIFKTIRNMVIRDSGTIQQKPSRSLLHALMDLVDIEGGNDFESMPSIDKAGLKHMLLAYGNHTSFYVPKQELTSTDGKRVIPVLTQYSDQHNFVYYDRSRSVIGTYVVVFPANRKGSEESYFVQEVLFVPGFESLALLKRVTGNKFEFWDMALEVPTHLTALTPCFQQIQPFQLLCSEAPSGAENEVLPSGTAEIQPMCCVLGADAAQLLRKKRDASVDCFTENQVICDLERFRYPSGGARTVYCRRNRKVQDGKRGNLVPVVSLRTGQVDVPELYVSTTVRFCRAVRRCCVKGSGGLVSYWNETLKELARDTFITGADMYEEIYQTALMAFIKRVNPSSWCNYVPKHLESVMDPIMVEVVELAIKFMDSGIPDAFVVAELLHCPITKVQTYLRGWNMYMSDKAFHTAVRRKRISIVEEQMKSNWAELTHVALSYARRRYSGNSEMLSACTELFKCQTLGCAAKVQKKWQALVKHDASKIKDKTLMRLYATGKVLFLKLRACYKKLRKGLRVGEEELGGASLAFGQSNDDDDDDDEGSSKLSVVVPKFVPVSSWIKNMSTLLLSEPWLNDNNLRREAVCIFLGLDGTLLHKRHGDLLRDWVVNNRSVVTILENYGLQDRLSKALVDCLRSTSTDNWRRKILLSFGCSGQRSRRELPAKPFKTPYKIAKKQHFTKLSSAFQKACNSQAFRPHDPWTSGDDEEDAKSEDERRKDEEDAMPGEDLASTADYDNVEEGPNDYDYDDDFIDDEPIEESGEEDADDDADNDADDDDDEKAAAPRNPKRAKCSNAKGFSPAACGVVKADVFLGYSLCDSRRHGEGKDQTRATKRKWTEEKRASAKRTAKRSSCQKLLDSEIGGKQERPPYKRIRSSSGSETDSELEENDRAREKVRDWNYRADSDEETKLRVPPCKRIRTVVSEADSELEESRESKKIQGPNRSDNNAPGREEEPRDAEKQQEYQRCEASPCREQRSSRDAPKASNSDPRRDNTACQEEEDGVWDSDKQRPDSRSSHPAEFCVEDDSDCESSEGTRRGEDFGQKDYTVSM